jgi:hypothetical protein
MDRDERPGRAKPLRSGRGAYIACSCFQDFLVRLRLGQNGNTALWRAHSAYVRNTFLVGTWVSVCLRGPRTYANLFVKTSGEFSKPGGFGWPSPMLSSRSGVGKRVIGCTKLTAGHRKQGMRRGQGHKINHVGYRDQH